MDNIKLKNGNTVYTFSMEYAKVLYFRRLCYTDVVQWDNVEDLLELWTDISTDVGKDSVKDYLQNNVSWSEIKDFCDVLGYEEIEDTGFEVL